MFQSPQFDVPLQSLVKKLEVVKQDLHDHTDQPLYHVEVVSLVSLLSSQRQRTRSVVIHFSVATLSL